jgi:hypothetical protein
LFSSWESKTLVGWWNDVLKGASHSVGKMIFKRQHNILLCVDGQQRCTTTMLLLLALRSLAAAALDHDTVALANSYLLTPEGASRLVPSLADRRDYMGCLQEDGEADPQSLQMQAVGLFQQKIKRSGMPLNLLVRRTVDLQLMYVEILNPVDLGQVFLWFQEKTCIGSGKLLYNPSPGVDFAALDLVRNLVLGPYMTAPRLTQETACRTQWLEPVEQQIGAGQEEVYLKGFITWWFTTHAPLPDSAFETTLKEIRTSKVGGMVSLTHILLYARIVAIHDHLNPEDPHAASLVLLQHLADYARIWKE